MLYRTMKKTGDQLSVLGFGCMRLPDGTNRLDEQRSAKLIHSAIERGVNYIDTAYPYHMGQEEPFLGKIIDPALRKRIKLATKLPPASVRTAEDMDAILNNQLTRLKTDRIDYYMLHGVNDESWTKLYGLGVLDFMEKAKKDGRILNAGFSFHDEGDSFKKIVDAYDWQFCQIQYNYFDQVCQAGTEGLRYAAERGLGIFVMEPLRGGLLAGRIPKEVSAIWQSAPRKRTPAEWALRWVWNLPEVTMVLSGMNDEGQVEENTRIAGEALPGSLSAEELAVVEKAKQAYQRLLKIGCTGCRYCMPCPKGVDIPSCFDLYNRVVSFGEGKFDSQFKYAVHLGGVVAPKTAVASQCSRCGQCEKKCPQHLPIPESLVAVRKEFETVFYRFMRLYSRFFFSRIR